jgi:5-methylcytosine-specific restriction protein B
VGISFFMRPDLVGTVEDIWSMEIEPYLEEYFFNQTSSVERFRWDKVRQSLGLS